MPELFNIIFGSLSRMMKKMRSANQGIREQKKSVRQPTNDPIHFCVGMRGLVQCIMCGDEKKPVRGDRKGTISPPRYGTIEIQVKQNSRTQDGR